MRLCFQHLAALTGSLNLVSWVLKMPWQVHTRCLAAYCKQVSFLVFSAESAQIAQMGISGWLVAVEQRPTIVA